jgi:hypothetical protein
MPAALDGIDIGSIRLGAGADRPVSLLGIGSAADFGRRDVPLVDGVRGAALPNRG